MSNLDAVLPYSSEIRDKVKSSIEKAYSDLDIKDEIDSNFIDYIDLLIENGKPLREIANSISEFAGSNISRYYYLSIPFSIVILLFVISQFNCGAPLRFCKFFQNDIVEAD